jgi:hypothetical protein
VNDGVGKEFGGIGDLRVNLLEMKRNIKGGLLRPAVTTITENQPFHLPEAPNNGIWRSRIKKGRDLAPDL